MAQPSSPIKTGQRVRSQSVAVHVSKSSGSIPSASPSKSPVMTKNVGASDLVLAFERTYLGPNKQASGGADQRLSDQELQILMTKETLRMPSSKKKKGHVQDLFGTSESGFANWAELDIAKKERRIRSLVERRPSMRSDLEKILDESVPVPKTIQDCAEETKDLMHPPLIFPSDSTMLLELGDKQTDFHAQLGFLHIEKRDVEVLPFRDWFLNEEYVIYYASDPIMGPIVISIQRQRKDKTTGAVIANCRILVRSKDTDEWLFVPSCSKASEMLDIFKLQRPQFFNIKFTKAKGTKATALAAKIVEMEEMMTMKKGIKIGILLCKGGQEDENRMFANSTTPAFEEFLGWIGFKIDLLGWQGFAGGLDTGPDSRTGKQTIYTEFDEFQLLFHVSTMLPYNPNDEQQLERKRHLGNDIVCLIFLEEESTSQFEHFFDPCWLHTGFTHVFFVVSPDKEMTAKTGVTHYKMAVAYHAGTTPFGPRIPAPASFPKNEQFRKFLLTKLINSERAALTAPAFQQRLKKVKETYLTTMLKLM